MPNHSLSLKGLKQVSLLLSVVSSWTYVGAQISDPIPGDVPFGTMRIELTEFAQIPASSGGGTGHARINHLKPDGTGRLFVNDLRGRMYLVSEGNADVYLDLEAEVGNAFRDSPGLGTGFTSFAFHPDFATNGVFYTAHAESGGTATADFPISGSTDLQGVITEWTATTPTAATWSGTRRELLRVDLVGTIHGTQEISFNTAASSSSDDYGMLYICIGDAQSPNRGRSELTHRLDGVLGSILRIDPMGTNSVNGNYGIPVDNPWASDGDPNTFGEIYAYGFRNPHRISWDADDETIMFAGEIGERNVEEINLIEAGNDYGWSEREGTFIINGDWENNPSAGDNDEVFELPANDDTLGFTYPIAQWDHDEGIAAIGGYVYRGSSHPDIVGQYIFADLADGGKLYHLDAGSVVQNTQMSFERIRLVFNGNTYDRMSQVTVSGTGNRDSDLRFGYDENNELYIISKYDGKVYSISGAVVGSIPKAVGENAGSTTITLADGSVIDAEVGDTVFDGENALGTIVSIDGSVITLEGPLAEVLAAGTTLSFDNLSTGADVQFVNIATRGLVGANAGDELIGGFVLLGENPQEVLIRGLGPDLTERGVAGALVDPVIEVRNLAGVVVATGDDWGDEANAADIAAAIAELSSDPASALADGSADAAILVTLEPNDVYTVVVSGKGGSGVALVEVFEKDQ
ncbi:MAG: hypothetical protein CL828_06090 [Crocinitomicaceae bacterium]|nr:hypothetical protein [Crocinitomicaceae bacterium]